MSWTRLSNDSCAYAKYLNQSVNPLAYQFDASRYENCNKCRNEIGLVGGTNVSHVGGNMVDLENDLRGQTRPVTKCPDLKHLPHHVNSFQRFEPYKTVQHPKIDLTKPKHLQPCQMNAYKHVPFPAPTKVSSCATYGPYN